MPNSPTAKNKRHLFHSTCRARRNTTGKSASEVMLSRKQATCTGLYATKLFLIRMKELPQVRANIPKMMKPIQRSEGREMAMALVFNFVEIW